MSREHHIGSGPGNTVVVAGGKYTTHRRMAKEIVDYTLEHWKKNAKKGVDEALPSKIGPSRTKGPVNPMVMPEEVEKSLASAQAMGLNIPKELLARYGADALDIIKIHESFRGKEPNDSIKDPEGFPLLAAQLRYSIQTEMVVHLEDFYLRRVPLYLARADHGLPWAEALSRVWAEERGVGEEEARGEVERLKGEIEKRSSWRRRIVNC